MDLSFSRTREAKITGATPVTVRTAGLPVLLAASAARQAASPTCCALASILRGQDGGDDRVQALAGIFAPRQNGVVDAACLSGSFHPGVANMMTVGTGI